jgi:hypothetical protein
MHVVRSFYQQLKWATESEWYSIKHFPVLIIQGKDDNITSMENALKLYEEVFNSNDRNIDCVRSSFKSLEGAGHMLMLEKSDIVADYIVEFVKEKINEQIQQYIPELFQINYNLNVVFVQDPERFQDIMFVNLKFADVDVYSQFGRLT